MTLNVLDELGYVNIKPEQTNIFFKLMEERHHRKPTLITTNLPYATWPDFLANPALTKALLSRLRERCHTVTIEGPCIRPPSDRLIESVARSIAVIRTVALRSRIRAQSCNLHGLI